MKKAILALSLILVCLTFSKAQSSINDYKYVIVEKQFHFQNEVNEYNLNELTRFLFRKHGFRPILDSEVFPKDLRSNYCLALKSEIIVKGVLRTKAIITLKDCDNNIIFTSIEGITKEKDLERAYNIVIRKAFESFNNINYKYTANKNILAKVENTENIEQEQKAKKEIEKLKQEIKTLKEEKVDVVKDEIPLIKEEKETKVEEKLEEIKEIPKEPSKPVIIKEVENYLMSEATYNGFKLINSISKDIEYTIYKTDINNVFIIKGKSGIIYKKKNRWIREYFDGDKTMIEFLDIRF